MLSEIKLYEITISKIETVPFLFFFKKKREEIIKYTLTYRIDEDRFWYYKLLNGTVIDDHLMKSYISSSISIMNNMLQRFKEFNNYLTEPCNIEFYSIKANNPHMYDVIERYSNSKEELYTERKENSKDKSSNNKYSGSFLLNDDLNLT